MIEFQNVTFSYPQSSQPALLDCTCTIHPGSFTVVSGASGSGKSTLLRCINGLVPHFTGGNLQGRIRVNGEDPVSATPRCMSRQVGFVFQDPENQFIYDTVEDEVAFTLENTCLCQEEFNQKLESVLHHLELDGMRRRKIRTLSGGEKQRVAIAASLAARPAILILDEPTSQLDIVTASEVLQWLNRIRLLYRLTVLVSEHRLDRVIEYADYLIFLQNGVPGVLQGRPQQVFESMNLLPPVVEIGKQLGWNPLPLTIAEAHQRGLPSTISYLKDKTPLHKPEKTGKSLLQVDALVSGYSRNPVLHGIDLNLDSGEILCVIGPNGSGKSTLLRSMTGLKKPMEGKVYLEGADIGAIDTALVCKRIAFLSQNPNAMLFADSVLEELKTTCSNHGEAIDMEKAHRLLKQLGLWDLREAYPRDLSTGERQRVALASLLITQPQVILLDEPTRGLDYRTRVQFLEILSALRASGRGILLVTHDVEMAACAADRLAILQDGKIVDSGAPLEVFERQPRYAPQTLRLFPSYGWLTPQQMAEEMQKHHSAVEKSIKICT